MCAFSKDDVKLGVVGCGKMASAILGGVAKNKFMRADDIYVYDINMDSSGVLCREYGFREAYSLKELVKSTDVILLAVKPFVVGEILAELKEYIDEQLILSILAGVKIKKYTSVLKNSKVIRIMPNTPALVNEGMSAICADNKVTNDELDFPYHCVPPLDLCAGVPPSPEGTPYVSGFFISLGSDLKSGTGRFD